MTNELATTENKEIQTPNQEKSAPEVIILKPQNEIFAQEYAKTGNGTMSYAISRGIDPKEIKENALVRNRCASGGSELLTRPKISKRISQIMTLDDFNDQAVDIQLNHLIQQHEDKKTKMAAIKEYNALKGRTGNKSNVFQGNTFNLAQMLEVAHGK